jgi:hypothetical protein
MYIVKLKDGPKRAKKKFLMILERVFKMVWWRGRKWNHIKKDIIEVEFLLSEYWLPLYLKRLLELFFFFLFFSFLSASLSLHHVLDLLDPLYQ